MSKKPAPNQPKGLADDLREYFERAREQQRLREEEERAKWVLVEGPAWGDCNFYSSWLLSAGTAGELLKQAKRENPELHELDDFELDGNYGVLAMEFLSKLVDGEYYSFAWEGFVSQFAFMVEMGFFTLTGERYQMTMPESLDVDKVEKAHLSLLEEEDYTGHVVRIPKARAKKYQDLLQHMDQKQRLADRQMLLAQSR